MSANNSTSMGKILLGIAVSAAVVLSALAGTMGGLPEEDSPVLGGTQDTFEASQRFMQAYEYESEWNIIIGTEKIDKEYFYGMTLPEVAYTNNGLLFAFCHPYTGNDAWKYGLYLPGEYRGKYDMFNYSVDYVGAAKVQTFDFTVNNERTRTSVDVPLAWICGYDPAICSVDGVQPGELHIPATITYKGKEYFVYGGLDGNDVWKNYSPFGANFKGGAKCDKMLVDGEYIVPMTVDSNGNEVPEIHYFHGTGTKDLLKSSKIVIHIAYDHYVIPPGFFRENKNIQSVEFEYCSKAVTWGTDTFYSSGYIYYLGDLAFRDCSKITDLRLPDRIDFVGYCCFSGMTSFTTLTFDTSVHSFQSAPAKVDSNYAAYGGFCFSGNTNLQTLILGKNVDNLPDNMFSANTKDEAHRTSSSNLKYVYNAGSKLSQDAIAKALIASGSASSGKTVFVFNLCGGTVETPADIAETADAKTGTKSVTITPPLVYLQDEGSTTYIPAWGVTVTPNGGTVPEDIPSKVETDSTVTLDLYPNTIITLNGTCTITYHIGNRIAGEQNLACEYATGVYGADRFETTMDGFTFSHWNTAPDNSGKTYLPGQTVVSVRNIDLYAQGTYQKFMITYYYLQKITDSNKTVDIEFVSTKMYTVGEDNRFASELSDFDTTVQLKKGTSYKLLNTSTKWCPDPKGSNSTDSTLYLPGETITFTEDTVLYSVNNTKNLIKYTVTYVNGDESASYEYSATGSPHSETVRSVMFEKKGYLFSHWTDGTNDYRPGEKITMLKSSPQATLTAVWIEKPEGRGTITYHANCEDGSLADFSREIELWVEFTLDKPAWTRSGLCVIGWATTNDTEYLSYVSGMKVVISEDMLTEGNMDLYAIWAPLKETTVIVVLGNTMIVGDGEEHPVYTGFSTIGLEEGYSVALTVSRCDYSGHTTADELIVSEPGVYFFTADCVISDSSGTDCTADFKIQVSLGVFTVLDGTSQSVVILGVSD